MFSFCFNVFIHSLIILQPVTVSASTLMSNILALIQPCCLCCVHQVICLADVCNVTDVCWCDYCHSLNKLCHLVSSMQDVEESLMSRRFFSTLTPPPTTSCASIITSTTRLQLKITAIAMLHFIIWHKESSPVSFKLIKSLLWSAVKLHLWYVFFFCSLSVCSLRLWHYLH